MSDVTQPRRLPLPPTSGGQPDPEGTRAWVTEHLGDLVTDSTPSRPRARGGQQAADAALAAFEVRGYAERRNEVWPPHRRGASGLSPWVRHGLLTLQVLWDHVADAPAEDRSRFRDELLWQEYARHLYARLGRATGESLRFEVTARDPATAGPQGWAAEGPACVRLGLEELGESGWLPNQVRMWMASWWVHWGGGGWRDGEDWMFRQLLDGSRAANRLGWQWVAGSATGSPWVMGRAHVERRAPGLCDGCVCHHDCPFETEVVVSSEPPPREPPDPRLGPLGAAAMAMGSEGSAEPSLGTRGDPPTMVWLTAESLGDDDPALCAHPDLPAVFVFDAPLLATLRLSAARMVFVAETLADLATRREVQVWRGDPVEVLAEELVAVTEAPVPGFVTRAASIQPVARHPWPWLVHPRGAPLRSFSAWRRSLPPDVGSGRGRPQH